MFDRLELHLLCFQMIMLFLNFDKSIRETLDLKIVHFNAFWDPVLWKNLGLTAELQGFRPMYFIFPFMAEGGGREGGPRRDPRRGLGANRPLLLHFCLSFRLSTGPRA